MPDVSEEELRKEIEKIVKVADLSNLSTKKVIQKLEETFDTELKDRRAVGKLVMDVVNAMDSNEDDDDDDKGSEEEKPKPKRSAAASKRGKADDDDDDSDDKGSEEEKPKPKRSAAASKRGKADDDDDDSDDASEEEPKPKPKRSTASAKRGKKARKASTDDSEEDDDSNDSEYEEKKAKPKKAAAKGKKAAGGKGGGRGKGGGYTRAYKLSPALADLMGAGEMPRHEVVKRMWAIIKEKQLYDPNNKQFAICDEPLYKVIGTKRFRIFGMMKYLKTHFLDE